MRVAWLLLSLAFVAGAAVPTQFGVNSQLRTVVGGPVLAAGISFLVGTVALLVAALLVRESLPSLAAVSGSAWWMWTGGLLGAMYVVASIVLTPRLGAATAVGLIIAGQMTASVVIDHFGLMRIPVHEVTLPRILGVLLILAGVVLIRRF
jgi:bacterial/archaeal transporter family-2 protein